MREIPQEWVDFLRDQFLAGSRIKIRETVGPCPPMAPGETGRLEQIDDGGRFVVSLKSGAALTLVLGEDQFSVLPPEPQLLKLYMPMSVTYYEKDDWGDELYEDIALSDREAVAMANTIAGALRLEETPEEAARGLMHYFDRDEAVNCKVQSYRFTAEARDGRLWGVAECMVTGDLTPQELAVLKADVAGQAADGFGEGFEQRPIDGGGRELYAHLWQGDDQWSIQTEAERFRPKLAEGLPELCFSVLPGTGALICIKRGESGYFPSDWSTDDRGKNEELAAFNNEKLGVTEAQRLAMETGSMHGWDVPGADPKAYEQEPMGMTLG